MGVSGNSYFDFFKHEDVKKDIRELLSPIVNIIYNDDETDFKYIDIVQSKETKLVDFFILQKFLSIKQIKSGLSEEIYSYLEENKLEDASKFAKKSIQINQKNFEAYNNLGLILKKSNDIKNSLINFHKALEINPNYLPTLINLAKNYDGLNDYNKAFNYISKALEIEPENINTLSILIYLKLKTCDWNGLDTLKDKLINLSIDFKDKVMQPYYSLLLTKSSLILITKI